MNENKTILLVDDNPDDQLLTKAAMEMSGIDCDVIMANNGEEALDYLFAKGRWQSRDVSSIPSLVLLDINMPRLDGFTVLSELRNSELYKFIPVVMLTTSKDDSDILRSYKLGANSYIKKPVDFDAFTEIASQIGSYWLGVNESFTRAKRQ